MWKRQMHAWNSLFLIRKRQIPTWKWLFLERTKCPASYFAPGVVSLMADQSVGRRRGDQVVAIMASSFTFKPGVIRIDREHSVTRWPTYGERTTYTFKRGDTILKPGFLKRLDENPASKKSTWTRKGRPAWHSGFCEKSGTLKRRRPF